MGRAAEAGARRFTVGLLGEASFGTDAGGRVSLADMELAWCMLDDLLEKEDAQPSAQASISCFPVPTMATINGVARQLCDALSHIHDIGLIHGDISLQNIAVFQKPFGDHRRGGPMSGQGPRHGHGAAKGAMGAPSAPFDSGHLHIKLCDFGACMHASFRDTNLPWDMFEEAFCMRYKVDYRPPEVLLGARYSYPADVWAMGVVLRSMLQCRCNRLRWLEDRRAALSRNGAGEGDRPPDTYALRTQRCPAAAALRDAIQAEKLAQSSPAPQTPCHGLSVLRCTQPVSSPWPRGGEANVVHEWSRGLSHGNKAACDEAHRRRARAETVAAGKGQEAIASLQNNICVSERRPFLRRTASWIAMAAWTLGGTRPARDDLRTAAYPGSEGDAHRLFAEDANAIFDAACRGFRDAGDVNPADLDTRGRMGKRDRDRQIEAYWQKRTAWHQTRPQEVLLPEEAGTSPYECFSPFFAVLDQIFVWPAARISATAALRRLCR